MWCSLRPCLLTITSCWTTFQTNGAVDHSSLIANWEVATMFVFVKSNWRSCIVYKLYKYYNTNYHEVIQVVWNCFTSWKACPRLIRASYGYSNGKVRHFLAVLEFHVSHVMLQEGNNIRRLCKKGCRKCDWLSIKTDVQLHIVKKL